MPSVANQNPIMDGDKEVKFVMMEKHTCNICFRTYSSLQSLKTHKRSHQSDKTFQCETCFKCFSERSTLKRHMYIHLEVKPFKCEHCDRAFSDKSTLRRHIITHTGAKRFQCNSCDKRFTRNEHLRQHNYIHTAQKLYKCDVCHKDFRQRSTLKNHMLLHRVEGSLKCESCGALFSRQQQYDKHMQWCNGDSTEGFKCEFCEKRFPDRNSLKRHQVIHSGERPFKCDYCEQSFNDRSILRRHMYIHTDRKPFQCTICQKEFIRKESLLSHMSCQHQQSVFEFVHPAEYTLNDGLPIEEGELDKQVRYVIQGTAPSDVDASISQVEVSTNNIQNDGVSMLAHAVCNIPQDVLQETNVSPALVSGLNDKADEVQNHQLMQKGDHQTLRIQVGPEPGIQTGDNHLLQVQIIQMGDGNQFVQSIQAIVQDEDKSCDSQTLATSQVLNTDGELSINNETNVIAESLTSHLDISGTVDMTGQEKDKCVDLNISKITKESLASGFDESVENKVVHEVEHKLSEN